jgi:hypothetical protein
VVTSYLSNVEDRRSGLFRHGNDACIFFFLRGLFRWYITWRRLIKNLTPWEEKSAGLNSIIQRITKALRPWDLNEKFPEIIDVPGMF